MPATAARITPTVPPAQRTGCDQAGAQRLVRAPSRQQGYHQPEQPTTPQGCCGGVGHDREHRDRTRPGRRRVAGQRKASSSGAPMTVTGAYRSRDECENTVPRQDADDRSSHRWPRLREHHDRDAQRPRRAQRPATRRSARSMRRAMPAVRDQSRPRVLRQLRPPRPLRRLSPDRHRGTRQPTRPRSPSPMLGWQPGRRSSSTTTSSSACGIHRHPRCRVRRPTGAARVGGCTCSTSAT